MSKENVGKKRKKIDTTEDELIMAGMRTWALD